jgi:hypothetical protein
MADLPCRSPHRSHVFWKVPSQSKIYGEQKANLLKSHCMARRPETDPILSREDLAELRRRLTMLSVDGVEVVYRTSYIKIAPTTAKRFHQQPPCNNWSLPGRCCGKSGRSDRFALQVFGAECQNFHDSA